MTMESTDSEPVPPLGTPKSQSPSLFSPSFFERLRIVFIGKPKDPLAPDVFHRLSLAAFLAWVGLGADGLSSSCYGPEEAFLALGSHTFLALTLAVLMGLTVFVI